MWQQALWTPAKASFSGTTCKMCVLHKHTSLCCCACSGHNRCTNHSDRDDERELPFSHECIRFWQLPLFCTLYCLGDSCAFLSAGRPIRLTDPWSHFLLNWPAMACCGASKGSLLGPLQQSPLTTHMIHPCWQGHPTAGTAAYANDLHTSLLLLHNNLLARCCCIGASSTAGLDSRALWMKLLLLSTSC